MSGYSGGGRQMIEDYEAGTAPLFELYGLGLKHKHLPEIMKYTGLSRRPVFIPSVGNFKQGMLVQLPLHLDLLPGKPTGAQLQDMLAKHYAGSEWVTVQAAPESGKLDALALNDTNKMELRVFANEEHRQAVLVARLDNLGKGASGAAVQNLKLMLEPVSSILICLGHHAADHFTAKAPGRQKAHLLGAPRRVGRRPLELLRQISRARSSSLPLRLATAPATRSALRPLFSNSCLMRAAPKRPARRLITDSTTRASLMKSLACRSSSTWASWPGVSSCGASLRSSSARECSRPAR